MFKRLCSRADRIRGSIGAQNVGRSMLLAILPVVLGQKEASFERVAVELDCGSLVPPPEDVRRSSFPGAYLRYCGLHPMPPRTLTYFRSLRDHHGSAGGVRSTNVMQLKPCRRQATSPVHP